MPSLSEFLMLAAVLFGLGIAGIILNRKNLIVLLMSIELVLLAVNTNFIAFAYFLNNEPINTKTIIGGLIILISIIVPDILKLIKMPAYNKT